MRVVWGPHGACKRHMVSLRSTWRLYETSRKLYGLYVATWIQQDSKMIADTPHTGSMWVVCTSHVFGKYIYAHLEFGKEDHLLAIPYTALHHHFENGSRSIWRRSSWHVSINLGNLERSRQQHPLSLSLVGEEGEKFINSRGLQSLRELLWFVCIIIPLILLCFP